MMNWFKQWLSPSRRFVRIVDPAVDENDEHDKQELRAWQSSIELRVQRLESIVDAVRKQDM